MDKARVYQLLESRNPADLTARCTQYLILALIVVSTIAMIVGTLPALASWSRFFGLIETAAIAIFTLEYLLRLWSCPVDARYASALSGRLRFFRSPMALIDLLAIVPFYLAFLPIDLRFLRLLRVLRILRLAKLARYSEALQSFGRVIVDKRYELGVTFFIGFILLIISSCLVYYAENPAQPERFSSIPATMWWAIATLTTVGYGDLYPITALGKFAGALVAITGIGMFALPTGILGAAFVEGLSSKHVSRTGHSCPRCGHDYHD